MVGKSYTMQTGSEKNVKSMASRFQQDVEVVSRQGYVEVRWGEISIRNKQQQRRNSYE